MASLLRQVIDSGAPPSLARLPMTPEEVAASYDDLEGPDADGSTGEVRPWVTRPRVTAPIVGTAMAVPSASQQQDREHCGRCGTSKVPSVVRCRGRSVQAMCRICRGGEAS
jgi:hypothetical protein